MQDFFNARQQDDDAATPLSSEASSTTRLSASSLPLLPFLDGGDFFEDDSPRSSSSRSSPSRLSRPQLLLPPGLKLKHSSIMSHRSSRSSNKPHMPRSFYSSSSAFHPRQQQQPSHAIVGDSFVTPVQKAFNVVSPSPADARQSLLRRKDDWDCVVSGSSSKSKLVGTSLLRRGSDDTATAGCPLTRKNGVKRQGNRRSSLPSRIGLTSRCQKHRKTSPADSSNNPEQESAISTSSREKLPFLFF